MHHAFSSEIHASDSETPFDHKLNSHLNSEKSITVGVISQMHLTALRPVLLGEKSQSHGRFTAREIIEHEWVQSHPPSLL